MTNQISGWDEIEGDDDAECIGLDNGCHCVGCAVLIAAFSGHSESELQAMIPAENLDGWADNMRFIVADSWEQVRRCDVYRLLVEAGQTDRKLAAMRKRIIEKRPDLRDEVEEVLADLEADRHSTTVPE